MSLDYAHELRLGLLAVERGYFTLGDLCAAIQRWSDEPDAQLLESLFARSQLPSELRSRIRRALNDGLRGPQPSLWNDPRFSEFLPEVEAACQRVRPPLNDVLRRLFDPAAVLDIAESIVEPLATTLVLDTDVRVDAGSAAPAPPDLGAAPADERFTKEGDPGLHGGMGKLYLGQDRDFNRPIAIKEIRTDEYHAAGDSEKQADLVRRFEHEARVTAKLQHPGVVPVYGKGKLNSGLPYFAMRYVKDGQTLQAKIEEYHARPRADHDDSERQVQFRGLLTRFVAVCRTVEYAHQQKVLHRDLKPANILCGEYGETLVLDWGLTPLGAGSQTAAADPELDRQASAAGGETPALTAAADTQIATQAELGPLTAPRGKQSIHGGTLGYASPEQLFGPVVGGGVGRWSDVYSLGATLLHLLLGENPPRLGLLPGGRAAFLGGDPASRSGWKSVPRTLRVVCLKAISLAPEARYPTAAALADDVERYLADQPVAAWGQPSREPRTERAQRWVRHNPRKVSGAAALLLAGVVALPTIVYLKAAARSAQATARSAQAQQLASRQRESLQRLATVEILRDVNDALDASSGGAAVRSVMLQTIVPTVEGLQASEDMQTESALEPAEVARTEFQSRYELGSFLSGYIDLDSLSAAGPDAAHKQALRDLERQAAELAAEELQAALDLSRAHADTVEFPRAERLELLEGLADLYLDPDLNRPESAIAVLEEVVALLSQSAGLLADGTAPVKTETGPSLGRVRLKLLVARLQTDRAEEALRAGLPAIEDFGTGRRVEDALACRMLADVAQEAAQAELALRSLGLGVELLRSCPDPATRTVSTELLTGLTLDAAELAKAQASPAQSGRYAVVVLDLFEEQYAPAGLPDASAWLAALECYRFGAASLDDEAHRRCAIAAGRVLVVQLRERAAGRRSGKRWRLPPCLAAIGPQLWEAGRPEAALHWNECLTRALQDDAARLAAANLVRLLKQRGIWLAELGRTAEATQAWEEAARARQSLPILSDVDRCEGAEIHFRLELLRLAEGDAQAARKNREGALAELAAIAGEHWLACGEAAPGAEDDASACLAAVEGLRAYLQSRAVEQDEPAEFRRLLEDSLEAWSNYDFERAGQGFSPLLSQAASSLAMDEQVTLQRRLAVCQAIERFVAGERAALDDLAAGERLYALECCARHWLEQSGFDEAVNFAERIMLDEDGAPEVERLIAAAKIYALAYDRMPDDDPADAATVDVEPAEWDAWRDEALRLLRLARSSAGAGQANALPLAAADFSSLQDEPAFRELSRNARSDPAAR